MAEAPKMLPRVGIDDATVLVRKGVPNALIIYQSDKSGYATLVESIQGALANTERPPLPAQTVCEVLSSNGFIEPAFQEKNLILLGKPP